MNLPGGDFVARNEAATGSGSSGSQATQERIDGNRY
jgi:hypothetical protein